ncbi:MAG: hypothetical protein ACOY9Y_07565 [Bacillota bacterium]
MQINDLSAGAVTLIRQAIERLGVAEEVHAIAKEVCFLAEEKYAVGKTPEAQWNSVADRLRRMKMETFSQISCAVETYIKTHIDRPRNGQTYY